MTTAEIYRELDQDARAELARVIRRDDAGLRYAHLSNPRRIKSFGDFRQSAKGACRK
jgi:hypothetical protein